MRAFEHIMERQKLMRITERSERMYLFKREKDKSEFGKKQLIL